MLELIFLSPLLAVTFGASIAYAVRRRPFAARGWGILAALGAGALALPLAFGVWVPDLIGTTRTLAAVTAPDGHSFHVVQSWNYGDFYSTLLHVTEPGGHTKVHILDADDSAHWSLPVSLDSQHRSVSVTLRGGARQFTW